MSGTPCSSNSRGVRTVTGDGPVAPRMRVPITVIVAPVVPSSAAWGPTLTTSAPACSSTTRSLPPSASRTACSTVKLPRTAGDRLLRTSSSANRISRPARRAIARSVVASDCGGRSNATCAVCALAGETIRHAWTAVAASSAEQYVLFKLVILSLPSPDAPALGGLTQRIGNYGAEGANIFRARAGEVRASPTIRLSGSVSDRSHG
ncbi:hypothetical protein D9M73_90010 [compost metagenome]